VVKATVPVAAGATYSFTVGAQGTTCGADTGAPYSGGAGACFSPDEGGEGGSASVLFDPAMNPLIVAGGGGGAGAAFGDSDDDGGNGGEPDGQSGLSGGDVVAGGGSTTDASGGACGDDQENILAVPLPNCAGGKAKGGDGGATTDGMGDPCGYGGGGGGGLYGGGGSCTNGGGGGSSYTAPTVSLIGYSLNAGAGFVTVTY
jgi:hypothetical protein